MTEYHVVWAIEVMASGLVAAAAQAIAIMRDPSSAATVLEITDRDDGRTRVIDIFHDSLIDEATPGGSEGLVIAGVALAPLTVMGPTLTPLQVAS